MARYLTSPLGAIAEEGVTAEDVAATGYLITKVGVAARYRTTVENVIAEEDVAAGVKLEGEGAGEAVITVVDAMTGKGVKTGLSVTTHEDAKEGE